MTKRWNTETKTNEYRSDIDQFIKAVNALCVEHQMSISHEDNHGGFIIVDYDEQYSEILNDASFNFKQKIEVETLTYDQYLDKYIPHWRAVPCSGWNDPHEIWHYQYEDYLKQLKG